MNKNIQAQRQTELNFQYRLHRYSGKWQAWGQVLAPD